MDLQKNQTPVTPPDDQVGRHVDGGPDVVARLAHVLAPVRPLNAGESVNNKHSLFFFSHNISYIL